jgi:uncharacterized membrane protein YjjP (DUF1212 family)
VGKKASDANELFAKLLKIQDELDEVRKDFVENTADPGRRDDYMLILGSGVRLSLSLCRLLQSEVELLRKAEAARSPKRSRKRSPRTN